MNDKGEGVPRRNLCPLCAVARCRIEREYEEVHRCPYFKQMLSSGETKIEKNITEAEGLEVTILVPEGEEL